MLLTLLGIKVQTVHAEDAEFRDWLQPSYLAVEERFSLLRKQREKNTLEWARNMPEFQTWHRSDLKSTNRLLWISATLGVGKSVMASYFIELLKCEYSNAFVGYFFCRSGEQGLTKAGEIIRTLAYQFVIGDSEARKELDSFRTHGKLKQNVAVSFLFEKFLEGLLTRTKKQVFIVLDGLDEADCDDSGTTASPARSEMEIFLQCLCGLPIRVLLISRPDIFGIIPKSFTKRLRTDVNMKDIDMYVEKTIEDSDQLKANFKAHPDVDARKYFHDKANGIFLWVVVVLHQLKQIKDIATFKTYISEFADASGDMWTLYARVLSKFEDETQRLWVEEILKWVVIKKTGMTIDQLEEVVNWSLKNKLADFKSFLEVECGALLDLIPSEDSDDITVHLIHETLRTFLVSSKSCPSQFRVDEKRTHYYACCVCLDILCTETVPERISYAIENWSNHLGEAVESELQYPGVLDRLHRFFHSPGCKTWIKHQLLSPFVFATGEIEVSSEERTLNTVWKYMQKSAHDDGADSVPARWQSEVVKTPWTLGEPMGKLAAQIWLHEDQEWNRTAVAFRLALKYYCKKHGRRTDIIESLQELAANDFASIYNEFGDSQRGVKSRNLGVSFYVLRLWSDAIRCYESEENVPSQIREAYIQLGEFYIKMADYEKAIEVFSKAVELGSENALERLGLAYKYVGNVKESINAFQKAANIRRGNLSAASHALPMLYLAREYAVSKDYAREIEEYQTGLSPYYNPWWTRECLEDAYLASCVPERVRKPSESVAGDAGTKLISDDSGHHQIGIAVSSSN